MNSIAYRKMIKCIAPILIFLSLASLSAGQTSSIWKKYQQAKKTDKEAPLPDYSYAGYGFGEKAIPDVEARVFDVTDFGAIPDDEESDFDEIQDAINAAEKNGGGIVFFPPGRFLISEVEGANKCIEVRGSNVVLRGSGAGEGGTTLFMRLRLFPADPEIGWSIPPAIYFTPLDKGLSSREILMAKGGAETSLAADAKRGDFGIKVADASGFKVGEVVSIAAEGTRLNRYYLDGLKTRDNWERINTRGVAVTEKHLIKKIEGNTLVFHAPLHDRFLASVDWAVIGYPVLQECGFEDIHVEGNFHEVYIHHKQNGFGAITMESCLNSWIRRCRFTNMINGASLSGCVASSMLHNEIGGTPGHSSFSISFGTNNLFGLSRDVCGYYHGPNVSHLAIGSVVWRYTANHGARGGPDFHATFPQVTLWDACDSKYLGSHGGNFKDLPNHLGGLAFWNFNQTGKPDKEVNYWDLLPGRPEKAYGPLTVVKPTIVGFHGADTTFDLDTVGYLESLGRAVSPESLYEAQLELRLGSKPEWIEQAKTEWKEILRDRAG